MAKLPARGLGRRRDGGLRAQGELRVVSEDGRTTVERGIVTISPVGDVPGENDRKADPTASE